MAERGVNMAMDRDAVEPAKKVDDAEARLDAKGVAAFLTEGADNQRREFPLKRVIGHDPLRQFLVEFPGGRLQALEWAWDPERKDWFDVFGTENRKPGEWGHWSGRGMNWNSNCAFCHNTRLLKNYDAKSDTYHTSMAEMTVSCESCHGPQKEHANWQRQYRGQQGDPHLTKLSRDQMLHACAACHARRGEVSGDFVPGESFFDHFSLSIPDQSDIFYPDGQVRDENYEFTAFLGSRMHAAGVRCVDCHDPHGGKRLLEGNALCMRCHSGQTEPKAPKIDPLAHSHHGENSAGNQCTSCHMPVTNYMQRHPRHDHGFTIPDPKLTREFGIPNACNRCHADKDVAWAEKSADQWYGAKMNRATRERAALLAKARRGDDDAREGLISFLKGNDSELWKASAVSMLSRWAFEPASRAVLLEQLTHASPLVRAAAVRALEPLVGQGDAQVRAACRKVLDDSSRSVRVAAAWVVRDELNEASAAGKDLLHLMEVQADQPTGQLQLGQYKFVRGQQQAALVHFRNAVTWDPYSPGLHHDLAIALSSIGDTSGAIRALQKAVELAPEEARYRHALGLAWNEAGSVERAIPAFEKAVALDPSMARAWYHLGLARAQVEKLPEALTALQRAETLSPTEPTVSYAKATVLARLGRVPEAATAAQRTLQLQPDHAEARQLLQSLRR